MEKNSRSKGYSYSCIFWCGIVKNKVPELKEMVRKLHKRRRTLCGASHLALRIMCGLLTLAQISQGETSHIPGTLGETANKRK